MQNLQIAPTDKTPEVSFDAQLGILMINGYSISEDPYHFYAPLLEWLDEYVHQPKLSTIICFQLDYFNTGSSMFIFSILRKLEELIHQGKQVKAQWYCSEEDETILQSGEDLKQVAKIPVEIIMMNSIT